MGKIIKTWWFWAVAVAVLAVAAIVALRRDELPRELPGAAAEGPQAEAADVAPPPEDTDSPVEPDVAAIEAPAEIVDVPEKPPVVAAEPEASADQIAETSSNVIKETMPTEDAPEGAAISADMDRQQADTGTENEEQVLPAEQAALAVAPPDETIAEAEAPSADPVPAPEAGDVAATPPSEIEVVKAPAPAPPSPDLIQSTIAQDDPALGAAPETEGGAASAPAAGVPPLLGESSPPLSLAQVLPPGVAPAPDQIAPSFDLVRVSPDGSALIAGRAAPGANVQVFSGTIPVAEATATARGEFVVFLNAPSAKTPDLQVPASPEGAALVVSQDDIVILPAAPDAADATPVVVQRSPDAVHILQPAAPANPLNVSLDLVSYSGSGAVQLAGRGQPGNVARIYADGTLAGEAPIAEGGTWELEVSDIAEGRYVLRVDEITPSGAVFSRTESPFQRQFPDAERSGTFSQGAKIIVQPGNTLWLMATEAYGNGDAYSQIYSANKDAIRDPDLIYPGQIFSIPRVEE